MKMPPAMRLEDVSDDDGDATDLRVGGNEETSDGGGQSHELLFNLFN